MNQKSSLAEMKGFYKELDSALSINSYYRKDNGALPIAVGADGVYMVMEQQLGTSKLMKLLEKCGKELK